MKSERLLNYIGQIDDRIIAEADTQALHMKPVIHTWFRWATAAAACIVVAVIAGITFIPSDSPIDSIDELPMLTIGGETGSYSFGFEGLMAYDISELQNGNPWTEETKLDTLPVYQNTAYPNGESGEYTRTEFENGVQLPDNYSFTYYETTEQQAKDVMEYLLAEYRSVVDMNSPALDLFGDYNIYGQRGFWFYAYENSGNLTDRIIGYNFNRVRFSPNDDGALWIIDRYKADLSQMIGEYPIITAREAKELLLQNRYISTVMEVLPGEEYIASVELVYRTDRYVEVFMPYYRFLVELPTMQVDNGLKTFGAYYVPAVESRYLTDMPLWDGRFN